MDDFDSTPAIFVRVKLKLTLAHESMRQLTNIDLCNGANTKWPFIEFLESII